MLNKIIKFEKYNGAYLNWAIHGAEIKLDASLGFFDFDTAVPRKDINEDNKIKHEDGRKYDKSRKTKSAKMVKREMVNSEMTRMAHFSRGNEN